MISVSSAIKQAIEDYPARVTERLNFTLSDSTTLALTNANIWQGGLTVEDSVSSDGVFEIGSTHIGQMKVSTLDDGSYSNIDFMDASVQLWLTPYGQSVDTTKGVYTVTQCVRHDGGIDITAYDNMHKFSKPYSLSTLTYPATMLQIVQDACTVCGVTSAVSSTFTGYNVTVSEKPTGENLTFREVLGYVAQYGGYNARCDNNGRLAFVRYDFSAFGNQHNISGVYNFNHSYYEVAITGFKVSVTTEVSTTDPDTGEVETSTVTTDYTSGTDDYQVVLAENPFITTANAQAVVDHLLALFGGTSFYVGDVSHSSDWTIECGDVAAITDRSGRTYNFLVSQTTFSTGSAQITKSCAEEPVKKIQPSVLDRIASSVSQAALDAKNAQNKASYASRIASDTTQYFWHTESGTDTGAHITEIPREDFLDDPTNGGGNLLARSNGIAVRDGLTELANFRGNGISIGQYANTRITIDTTNGLMIGDAVQITPTGNGYFTGNITADSGSIADLNIQKVSAISDQYPLYSDGDISATASGDITVDDSTHIVTVVSETTVKYFFSASHSGQTASAIYYSPILTIAEDESAEEADQETDPDEEATPTTNTTTTTQSEDKSIAVTIKYLDGNGNVISGGTHIYTSTYLESGVWTYKLDASLLESATNVSVEFSLLEDSTISLRVGYGVNSGLMYNTTKLLTGNDSIYVGTDGMSVGDKVALLPTGTVMTDYIEVRGKGMEFVETDIERLITLRNRAYDEGKTYADDHAYPHYVTLYGGSATSQMAFGLWDRRKNTAVWRYDDHNNLFRIEKKTVLYNHLVPSVTNSSYVGTDDARFSAAYIRAMQIGLKGYSTDKAVISSKWKDGNTHDLIRRQTDGLTARFGWNGSSTYPTSTEIHGYTASLNSHGGGIDLNGAVRTSSTIASDGAITSGGAIRTYGKTADGDGVAGNTFGAGTIHMVRDGNPAIYFYRNRATAYSNWLGETETGVLHTQKSFNTGSTISYTATYASGETPSYCDIRVSAGLCTINYMGANKAHSGGATLFTLPTGCRPKYEVHVPCVFSSSGYGTVTITTAGVATIGFISNTSATARVYISCSFAVV